MVLSRKDLGRLASGQEFIWATGIEDTFIADPWPKTGRILDEYELTGHYERWTDDLALMSELGVRYARYGIPWYRINPEPGKWDWDWSDRALDRQLSLGINPIVDLVHYGTPGWLTGAFADADYPQRVAEYAGRAAERYHDRIKWFTPLNEPRITAWYCGKLGWWPPYKRGWSGFVAVMLGICKGIVLTSKGLSDVDDSIVQLHVDATDLYVPMEEALVEMAGQRQEIVFLALDLITGRVDERHSLWAWLLRNGASESDLRWFLDNAIELDLIGINMYPMFSRKELSRRTGSLRGTMRYAGPEIVAKLCKMYSDRYSKPVLISETASVGSVRKRRQWMHGSIESVREARCAGVPIVGYTWWPMFALVTWAYRQHGIHDLSHYILQMGLWDFDSKGPDPLRRVRTSLVDEYRTFAESNVERVGTVGGQRCSKASS